MIMENPKLEKQREGERERKSVLGCMWGVGLDTVRHSLLYLFSLSLWHVVWSIFLPLRQILNCRGSNFTHGGHTSRDIPEHRDYVYSSKWSGAVVPGTVLGTVSQSSTQLNCYVSSRSSGRRVTAHLANNSWAQFRSWHWPGIIPNGNLDTATLI